MVKLNTLHGYSRAAAAELIKVKKYFFTSRESPGMTLKELNYFFHFFNSFTLPGPAVNYYIEIMFFIVFYLFIVGMIVGNPGIPFLLP